MLSGHLVLPADVHEQAVVMPPRRKRTPRETPRVGKKSAAPTAGSSSAWSVLGWRAYRCAVEGCEEVARLTPIEPLPAGWTTTPCGLGKCSYRCPAHSGARA